MVIEAIGRRLRLAVIGGGPGSVIGEVHRIAARLDGYYDIVAATLSSDPKRARRGGIAIGVPEDRALSVGAGTHRKIIERYRADKAFLGSTGFTAEMGHSTPDPDDAQVKEAFIRIADETYVLVDSSKYGHNCLTSFVQLRDVRLTVTDNRLLRAKAKTLQAAGAKLRIAEVADEAI